MIVITGAYGFIGSALVTELNQLGYQRRIIVVDDFYKDYKEPNLNGKVVKDWIHRDLFIDWFERKADRIEKVIHLGARTDTATKNVEVFDRLNLAYSKRLWEICTLHDIPFIYASSAATYGDGSMGFDDDDRVTQQLNALNPYGSSKLEFDQWVLNQDKSPSNWIGFRFFNVYGPNEYHKGRMASVIFHAVNQIRKSGEMRLFKSHRDDVKHGEQKRDFIYVKDVLRILTKVANNEISNGIYNLGTGKARTFNDLTAAVFKAMNVKEKIHYIDMPEDIRSSYQYYTEANMSKLLKQLNNFKFTPLEEGVNDYVTQYLITKAIY